MKETKNILTENTDKAVCRELTELLSEFGVRDVVLSPGTRNAPLIMAVARHPGLDYRVIVDERSAAFAALGIAAQSGRPVAVVCTSGTAVLNYAPAVAEAYYRGVPLIVISADRPAEWIDQDDSQTIRQFEVLENIVKMSIDIPVENGSAVQMWMINRKINDALIAATTPMQGPVHINVQLEVPLTNTCITDMYDGARVIDTVLPEVNISTARARALGKELAPPRHVLVIAGFLAPSAKISKAMTRLAAQPNIAVLAEAQANLHSQGVIANIDRVLSSMSREQRDSMHPDLVITVGGSLVSRFVKEWIRGLKGVEHWHVGRRGISVDCFKCLTRRIELPADTFLSQLASAVTPYRNANDDYASNWRMIAERAADNFKTYVNNSGWCDLTAIDTIVGRIPARANLHVSNGTCIRYVQLCDYGHIHRIDCNRGVSGIDGCTSTAIGAAMAYKGLTVMLSGDMSAQYDLSAFAIKNIPSNFRMIVINNGGGGIFRFISATRAVDELDECFAVGNNLPLKYIAYGFGFKYIRVENIKQLSKAMSEIALPSDSPVIVEVVVPTTVGAENLTEYFRTNKKINI